MILYDHDNVCDADQLVSTMNSLIAQEHCITHVYRVPSDPTGVTTSDKMKYRIQSVTAEER